MTRELSIVSDDTISFQTWQEEQDHEYHRINSEVVDYLNDFVDYDTLDRIAEENGDVEWQESLCQVSGMNRDSDEFDMARTHITTYINAQQ